MVVWCPRERQLCSRRLRRPVCIARFLRQNDIARLRQKRKRFDFRFHQTMVSPEKHSETTIGLLRS